MVALFGCVWAVVTTAVCVLAVASRRSALAWMKARRWRKSGDDTVDIVRTGLRKVAVYAALVVLALPAAVYAGSTALPGPGGPMVGGTIPNALTLTGDNASGTGTLRIRPSDEDTQLVLCEASNNASPEVCSSIQHANVSSTIVNTGMISNGYMDSAGALQRNNTSFGQTWHYATTGTTAANNIVGMRVYGTGGAAAGDVNLAATAAATSTLTVGALGTVTNDFRGPITNGGSATCNGVAAGSVCVNDPPVFYDGSATFAAQFGSSAANSSTQIWEYTQGTAGQATTLFATGTMASPTAVGAVGYYGSTYTDADVTDDVTLYSVGKEIDIIRSDNVVAAALHTKWIDDASASSTLAGVTLMTLMGDGTIKPTFYGSQTDCTDNAGAAACGAAPTGAVVLDDGSTTVVVSTTAVTANSTISVNFDPSLGTKLGITCNTTQTFPYVSARTAATSFTITSADPAGTNKACFSYSIIN